MSRHTDPEPPDRDGALGAGPVVVGVHPGQGEDVPGMAAAIAARLGVDLVCVWVDPTGVLVRVDGTEEAVPVDPDSEGTTDDVDADLRAELADRLDAAGVGWSYERTAGDARDGLSAAAERHDATLIAVGSHHPGLGRWMETLIGTSVAGHLAHSQHRPVTILPNLHHDHRHDHGTPDPVPGTPA